MNEVADTHGKASQDVVIAPRQPFGFHTWAGTLQR